MVLEKEIEFLIKFFNKLHIQSSVVGMNELKNGKYSFDVGIREILGIEESFCDAIYPKISVAENRCVYTYTDRFSCTYTFFSLENGEVGKNKIMFIGPYLQANFSEDEIRRKLLDMGVGDKVVSICLDYYFSLEKLDSSSRLFMTVETLCDMLWGEGNYTFHTESENFEQMSELTVYEGIPKKDADNIPDERFIETRYEYENEMMKAIESGQAYKRRLITKIAGASIENRSPDFIRNMKNYSIIMNTLARKSAEFGGVHPIHLDSVSRSFALKIENASSINAVVELMNDMFTTYCSLVKKHSLRGYAPPVQKAITYINAEISSPNRLCDIAERLGLSSGYLSDLFKKQTGTTLTDFVNNRKIDYSAHLLTTTNKQVQDIAVLVGIVDVQYFSKLFKKIKGETPLTYRKRRIAKTN